MSRLSVDVVRRGVVEWIYGAKAAFVSFKLP